MEPKWSWQEKGETGWCPAAQRSQARTRAEGCCLSAQDLAPTQNGICLSLIPSSLGALIADQHYFSSKATPVFIGLCSGFGSLGFSISLEELQDQDLNVFPNSGLSGKVMTYEGNAGPKLILFCCISAYICVSWDTECRPGSLPSLESYSKCFLSQWSHGFKRIFLYSTVQ